MEVYSLVHKINSLKKQYVHNLSLCFVEDRKARLNEVICSCDRAIEKIKNHASCDKEKTFELYFLPLIEKYMAKNKYKTK